MGSNLPHSQMTAHSVATSQSRAEGRRSGQKWAVEWLHKRAKEMTDPHAAQVLNAAAFAMGNDAKLETIGGAACRHQSSTNQSAA